MSGITEDMIRKLPSMKNATPPSGNNGLFAGGTVSESNEVNTIFKITITSLGNSDDFGDLTRYAALLGSCSNGANSRGLFAGGTNEIGSPTCAIDYVNISTDGNAESFGELSTTGWAGMGACSNKSNNRGIFAGGAPGTNYNYIHYISISSLGDSTLFGKLVGTGQHGRYTTGTTDNGTSNRGIFSGGNEVTPVLAVNTIEYITMTSLGDADDFGDLTFPRYVATATSNTTGNRGVIMGGYYRLFGGGGGDTSYPVNIMDYVNISSTGNANDFGDLLVTSHYSAASLSNAVGNRGVNSGGTSYNSIMEYINILSLSNATLFGYLTSNRGQHAACANAQ